MFIVGMRYLILRMMMLSVFGLIASLIVSIFIPDRFTAVIVAFNIGLDLCAAVTIGLCMYPDPTEIK